MDSHPTQETSANAQQKQVGNACNKQYTASFEQVHS